MKEEKNITNTIQSQRPSLSQEERLLMWDTIKQQLPAPTVQPILSPFLSSVTFRNIMTSALIFFIILLGGGGTVALASDASRPGDFLFPLERTIEDTQLNLAFTQEDKEFLVKLFTEERLQELREIVDEELVVSPSNLASSSTQTNITASSTDNTLEIEAHVFTDMTVVKLELNDQKFYFEADTNTREGVIAAILERFPMLTSEQIDSQLGFSIEDRESRPKDRGVISLSLDGEVRINRAVEAIMSFLDSTSIDDVRRDNLLTRLSTEVDGVTKVRRNDDRVLIGAGDSRFEIRVDDNGDSRVEIRDGESRIRIEEKDGEVRIKTSDDSDDTDDRTEDSVRSMLASSTDTSVAFEVEADVFIDTTIVKIELGDQDFTFETNADTRAEVIAEIHKRFGSLTSAQIDSKLDFEVENRTSRPEDGGTSAVEDVIDPVVGDSTDVQDSDEDEDDDEHESDDRVDEDEDEKDDHSNEDNNEDRSDEDYEDEDEKDDHSNEDNNEDRSDEDYEDD